MGVPTHAMDCSPSRRRAASTRLGKVAVFYMAGSPIPPAVAAGFVDLGIKPQNIYGMTENASHQYTHPDDATEITSPPAGGRAGLRDAAVGRGRSRSTRSPRRGRRDRRRGGALMLGYFDNQAATETSFNATAGSCPATSACSTSAATCKIVGPQEGPDHPRRPQHLSRAHRGAGAAPHPGGARRLLSGGRRAAGRARVPRHHAAASSPTSC